MSHVRAVLSLAVVVLFLAPVRGESPFRYTETKLGKAELKYINGLPVLMLEGTPEEMGEQVGALMSPRFDRLLNFPREYLKHYGHDSVYPMLVKISTQMAANFPPDHLRELDAMVKRAGVAREVGLVGNTFMDIKKVGGCSTLIIGSARSATGGPLFGRNLDYPTLGYLHEYTLVTVYRPKGKHAFASVGFPGFIGCLSGINDAGLALATLEVYQSNDDSLRFDPQGTPYTLSYRRILEECSTVAEAEKLLRSMKRTTRNNLAVCDRNGGVVFEITPKNVVVRRPEDDICPCTNHFRSKQLATRTDCRRYEALLKVRDDASVSLEDMSRLLRTASQPDTLQTMIFEPAELRLHLAIGKVPSADLTPKPLDLEPLLRAK